MSLLSKIILATALSGAVLFIAWIVFDWTILGILGAALMAVGAVLMVATAAIGLDDSPEPAHSAD